jgi:hypothetical protein
MIVRVISPGATQRRYHRYSSLGERSAVCVSDSPRIMDPDVAFVMPIVGDVTVWPMLENDETPPPEPVMFDWYMKLVNV